MQEHEKKIAALEKRLRLTDLILGLSILLHLIWHLFRS